jgi:hypothetical protein
MNGQTDRGIGLLRRAVALSPNDPVARLTLAQDLIEQDIERNAAEAVGPQANLRFGIRRSGQQFDKRWWAQKSLSHQG